MPSPALQRIRSIASSVGGLALFALVFSVCNVLPAKQDYDWAPDLIAEAEGKGWQTAYIQRNYIDITRPWMVFNPPPVGLYFVRKQDMAILPSGLRAIDVLILRRTHPPVESIQHVWLFDCSADRYAIFAPPPSGTFDPRVLASPSFYPMGRDADPAIATRRLTCQ